MKRYVRLNTVFKWLNNSYDKYSPFEGQWLQTIFNYFAFIFKNLDTRQVIRLG